MQEEEIKRHARSMLDTAVAVITRPAEFFRTMPKTGGLVEPLLFLVVIGVVTALVQVVLSIFLPFLAFGEALLSVVLVPIIVAVFGFVVAGVFFLIWKLMGSAEPYEVAYRCVAYAAAITPIATVFGLIPYIGTVVGLLWWTLLLVLASVEVHAVRRQLATGVFGGLCAFFILVGLWTEYTARKFAGEVARWGAEMEREFGTPDEQAERLQRMLERMQREQDDR